MEDLRDIFRKSVECIYYVRKKKMKMAIPLTAGIGLFLYAMVSLICYVIGECIFHNYHIFTISDSFIIVGSVLMITVAMNVLATKKDVFKIVLEHMFLHKQTKQSTIIEVLRVVVIAIMFSVIWWRCSPILSRVIDYLQMNEAEAIIMVLMIIFGGSYFLLTDTIIDDYRRHKAKAIASVLIMIIMIFLYIFQISENNFSQFDVYALLIFCIGLLAFLDSAINNYRDMYRCLGNRYQSELDEYFAGLMAEFDTRFNSISNEISSAKECGILFLNLWNLMNTKKKILFVTMMVVAIAFAIGMSILSGKISGYMMRVI